MKKFALLSIFIPFIIMFSCQKQEITEEPNLSLTQDGMSLSSDHPEDPVVKNLARHFYKSLSKKGKETLSDITEISIEKIECGVDDDLWVANYPDNGGYIVISGNNPTFPIVTFNTCGQFHYDKLSTEAKKDFNRLVDYSVKKIASTRTEGSTLWDYLSIENKENSDTTYVISVDFFADKLLGDSTVINDIPRIPVTHGGGKIPHRKYANGYPTIPPLLEFVSKRQWTTSMPYCYDLPWSYSGGDPLVGRGGPCWLDPLTVCFALVIDSYRLYPSYSFWNSQPNTQTTEESTELTRFFKQLSDDMGCTYHYTQGTNLAWSNRSTTIPNIMNKYKLEKVNYVPYYPTQEGFDMLMNHLNSYNPIILMSSLQGMTGPVEPRSNILDGVCEIYTKVTTKKVVIGISVSTTVDYYYMDYFHRISPGDHSNDGWILYDALNTDADYAYLLKKKMF